jgi:hypothetical protein
MSLKILEGTRLVLRFSFAWNPFFKYIGEPIIESKSENKPKRN